MAITEDALIKARKRAELMQQGSGASGPISEQFIRSLAGDTGAGQQLQQEISARTKVNQPKRATTPQDDLISLQKKQGLSELEAARKRALVGLGEERTAIGQESQKQRVGAGVQRQKEAGSFGEFLAQRGLQSSGAGSQGEIARGVTEQQALTDIGQRETTALGQLRARETAAGTEFELGKTQLGFQEQAARIAQQQQEQTARDLQAQQLQQQQFDVTEEDRIRQADQENKIALTQLDSEIRNARDTNDFAREQQLINQRAQIENEQIRLREAVKPQKTAADEVDSDTLRAFQSGLENRINTLGGFAQPEQLKSLVREQAIALRQAGGSEQQVRNFANANGFAVEELAPPQAAEVPQSLRGLLQQ